MEIQLSKKAMYLPPSGIRAMTVLASKYNDVISFGLGEPDFQTPKNIVDAGCKALRDGYTKYVPNQGMPVLLRALAQKVRDKNGMQNVTEENIHITFGAGQGLLATMEAVLNPGDEVLVPTPCFPNYFGYIEMAGGVPVPVETYEKNGFRVTAADIKKKISPKSKMLIVNSPCNPTGAVLEEEDLRAIGTLAIEQDLVVVSDEPYEDILYDGRKPFSIGSIAELSQQVITVNSFSKSYAMTGWRIGYVVAPIHVRKTMTVLQESMGSSVTAMCQMAALEALEGIQTSVSNMREEYERRRNLLVQGLNQINGFSCIMPGGAFYAFPNISALGLTSEEVAMNILEQVQVLVTPGSAFGPGGEGFLRFSYASSEEKILEGIRRLKKLFGEKKMPFPIK